MLVGWIEACRAVAAAVKGVKLLWRFDEIKVRKIFEANLHGASAASRMTSSFPLLFGAVAASPPLRLGGPRQLARTLHPPAGGQLRLHVQRGHVCGVRGVGTCMDSDARGTALLALHENVSIAAGRRYPPPHSLGQIHGQPLVAGHGDVQ